MRLANHLTAVFEPAEEGGFVAYIPEMPGVASQGETMDEARENLLDALELVLEVRREQAGIGSKPAHNESLYLSEAA